MTHCEQDQIEVVKRDGSQVSFNSKKIFRAIEMAFRDVYRIHESEATPEDLLKTVQKVFTASVDEAVQYYQHNQRIDIEMIQDIVEKQLMAADQHAVAKSYILYREERNRARALKQKDPETKERLLYITHKDGLRHALNIQKIKKLLENACQGLLEECSVDKVLEEGLLNLYDGATTKDLRKALIMAARPKIEQEPAYSFFTARLLLQEIYEEVLDIDLFEDEVAEDGLTVETLQKNFADYITLGVKIHRLSPELQKFDLEYLSKKLEPTRDHKFQYIGLQILYDRYLIRNGNRRIETPQYFWMRVAMGLALNEKDKEKRAAEFYDVLSQFHFVSSTPTLFNSGTMHPQLSSCFLLTVQDSLENIFKIISDNARLSKWAGGIGNDWTNVRAMGAYIKGTNGLTQGIIPFLKVANDTAVAVNQGGKRKGSLCVYLETWHLDVEDFLELRKNTGDERRRTHDINTANWIPDLFMKRVHANGTWTLFNPSDVKDLHDLYGHAFERRYEEYERMAMNGQIVQYKTVPATDLWRKMLTMLYETGHPWITFKDPCNIRSPQSNAGVVHSSNLCTEITLNTSETETAVCNLGSINLAFHMKKHNGKYVLDKERIAKTISTAIRMLDNVIDINFYPIPEARNSNVQNRPIGLGLMGFQDVLYMQGIPYDCEDSVEFADTSMELISYHAIMASAELAKERGAYPMYKGSKWEQGMLPIDTLDLLEKERGGFLEISRASKLDWTPVREAIRKHGMRNSNTMAIAPTATIAHISGVCPSIEPTYSNLFSRSNLSGEFTMLNPYLVGELKKLNIWDEDMIEELKYYDGSILSSDRIPNEIKALYKTSFEINPKWLVECASRRQKWIDMGQSLNLYVSSPSGRLLNELYFLAWTRGLKTTYYLRSQAATQVEKSTVDINKKSIQPRWMKSHSASSNIQVERKGTCRIDDPECESCQ